MGVDVAAVQPIGNRTIRLHVIAPPDAAPYFPDSHHRTSPDGSRLYLYGHLTWPWAPSANGYANEEGEVIQFHDDGTWERFHLGPPYYGVVAGTWQYVP